MEESSNSDEILHKVLDGFEGEEEYFIWLNTVYKR